MVHVALQGGWTVHVAKHLPSPEVWSVWTSSPGCWHPSRCMQQGDPKKEDTGISAAGWDRKDLREGDLQIFRFYRIFFQLFFVGIFGCYISWIMYIGVYIYTHIIHNYIVCVYVYVYSIYIYICWVSLLPSNSHRQDSYIFRLGHSNLNLHLPLASWEGGGQPNTYCWWLKSCTTRDV